MSFVIPLTDFLQLHFTFLSRFRIVNQCRPLLDAFHGSYKDKHYNWVVINIVLRSCFFALYGDYGLTAKLRLLISTTILILFIGYHGYIHPNKNTLVNIQELLLLLNLTILHAVSYYDSGYVFSLVANTMISLALVQFLTIVLHHFLTYTLLWMYFIH